MEAHYHAAEGLVFSSLGDEAVILGLNAGVYYGLNAVGARVWEQLQMPQTLDALCEIITAEFAVTPEQCQLDIQALLADLQKNGLVVVVATPGQE